MLPSAEAAIGTLTPRAAFAPRSSVRGLSNGDATAPCGVPRCAGIRAVLVEWTRERKPPMPKKIDPLNKKTYAAITASLCVTDVKAAASFYQKAFGFEKRGIMNGPDGKPMHAELTIRG